MLRALEIAESTWNRWQATYRGMKVDAAKRLEELEAENARLKRLLTAAELDMSCHETLREVTQHC